MWPPFFFHRPGISASSESGRYDRVRLRMKADQRRDGILPRPLIVMVAALVLAFAVFIIAWAGVFRLGQPERALLFAPWDARARSMAGAQMVVRDPSPAVVRQASALAASALGRQPIDPVAIRLIGGSREVDGRRPDALKLMLGAQMLSRRDLLTQLWLIEYFSQTDDIERVLRHYEIALTGSNQSAAILFPVLVGALDDPNMVRPVAGLMQRGHDRRWRASLLNELLTKPTAAPNVAALASFVLDPSRAEDQPLYRVLIRRLVELGAFEQGFDAYRRVTRDAAATAALRDPGFRAANRVPPFDWELFQDLDRTAAPVPGAAGGLQFSANGSVNGLLARQLVRLSPATYRMSFDLALEGGAAPGLTVFVSCASMPGQPGTIVERAPIPSRPGQQNVIFTTTPRCQWHLVDIAFEGAGEGELAGTLSGLKLQQTTEMSR